MNKLYLVIPLFCLGAFAQSTYYVDCNAANDLGAGTSTGTAWKTIAKVNSTLTGTQSDTTVLLNRGCTWREQLTVPGSGAAGHPFNFGAYGSGAKPIISGSDLITGPWTQTTSTPIMSDAFANGTGWSNFGASFTSGQLRSIVSGSSGAYRGDKALTGGAKTEAWITLQYIVQAGYTVTDGNFIQFSGLYDSASGGAVAGVGMKSVGGVLYWRGVTSTNAGGASGLQTNTSATVVTTGVTHNVEAYIRIGSGTGVFAYWVDGVFQTQLTGLTNTNFVADRVTIGENFNPFGYTASVYYDNLATFAGTDTASNIWQQALTTEPKVLTLDGGLGQPLAFPPGATSADKSWYWAGNVLYVSSTSIPSSRFAAVEAGTRTYAIYSAKDYVTFQNLTAAKANLDGEHVNNASHNTFDAVDGQFNYRSGLSNEGSSTDNTSFLIVKNGDYSSNGLSGVEIHGGGGAGAFGQPHDFTIQSNAVHGNGWTTAASVWTNGIKVGGDYPNGSEAYNALIENNDVYSNSSVSATRLGTGVGIWVDEWGTGAVVRYNKTHDNDAPGLMVEHHTGTVVYGNIAYNNSLFWTAWLQIWVTRSASNNLVYNNTCYGGAICYGVNGSGTDVTMTGNALENNIAFGYSGKALSATLGGENAGSGSGNVYLYNAFGSEATNFILWGAANKSTYAAFDSAYGASTHSVAGDPKFSNPGASDFTLLSASPCINSGTNLGSTYQNGLGAASIWPAAVTTVNQNTMGPAFEIGAYVYVEGVIGVGSVLSGATIQ